MKLALPCMWAGERRRPLLSPNQTLFLPLFSDDESAPDRWIFGAVPPPQPEEGGGAFDVCVGRGGRYREKGGWQKRGGRPDHTIQAFKIYSNN